MSPERWKQIEEVFQSALDLPRAERRGFIAGACAGMTALWNWQTCLPVGKRRRVAALQIIIRKS